MRLNLEKERIRLELKVSSDDDPVIVTFPHKMFNVISGSRNAGKSFLAHHTIYCESYRRLLGRMPSDVPYSRQSSEQAIALTIDGLLPSYYISATSETPLGDTTVSDFLGISNLIKSLLLDSGHPYCGHCKCKMHDISIENSNEPFTLQVSGLSDSISLILADFTARIFKDLDSGNAISLAERFFVQGFRRFYINDKLFKLSRSPESDPGSNKEFLKALESQSGFYLVLDSASGGNLNKQRIIEALRIANELGSPLVLIEELNEKLGSKENLFVGDGFLCFSCQSFEKRPCGELFVRSKNNYCKACGKENEIKYQSDKKRICSLCYDTGFSSETFLLRVFGKHFGDLSCLTIAQLLLFVNEHYEDLLASKRIVRNLLRKCELLENLNVSYLNLNTRMSNISSGERLKVRLAEFFASEVTEILLIIDHVSYVLHEKERALIYLQCQEFVKSGGTVLVADNDKDVLGFAEHLVVLEGCPSVGSGNFSINYQGEASKYHTSNEGCDLNVATSLSACDDADDYLTLNSELHEVLSLGNIKIPLNKIVAFVGNNERANALLFKSLLYGAYGKNFRAVEFIDNCSILKGRGGSGSKKRTLTVAKFLNIEHSIAKEFASLPSSRVAGLENKDFVLSLSTEVCPKCLGEGYLFIDLEELGSSYEICDECSSMRFTSKVLAIRKEGKNIYEVCSSRISDAKNLFRHSKELVSVFNLAEDFSLGNLKMFQAVDTLSYATLSNLRIAKVLQSRKNPKDCLLLMDKPFCGMSNKELLNLKRPLKSWTNSGGSLFFTSHDKVISELVSDTQLEI